MIPACMAAVSTIHSASSDTSALQQPPYKSSGSHIELGHSILNHMQCAMDIPIVFIHPFTLSHLLFPIALFLFSQNRTVSLWRSLITCFYVFSRIQIISLLFDRHQRNIIGHIFTIWKPDSNWTKQTSLKKPRFLLETKAKWSFSLFSWMESRDEK